MGGKKYRILIADDDDSFRELMEAMLESENIEILLAEDGEDALKKFEHEKPDLLITDMMMPKVWGLDLIGAVQGVDPGFPIIAISGISKKDELERLKRLGVRAVFSKPFKTAELKETVMNCLQGKDAGQAS